MTSPPADNAKQDHTPHGAAEAFIRTWQGQEGGQERANYALFLTQLCGVLGVPTPEPAGANTERNDYVFERMVRFQEGGESAGHGRIDLYKRGCFVLEAKQSRQGDQAKAIPGQEMLFAEMPETGPRGRRGARRGWDVLMLNARRQAEDYARALPETHDWPPFILVCDVGHCIEVFADFSGRGRNYTQFPDRQNFRIYLEELSRPDVRERLRLIWTDPHLLDPTKRAAEATRAIAKRLAEVSKSLEQRGFAPEDVAMFLMRCLFTMFAEDVELLPKDSFKRLLERCRDKPENFPRLVGHLWETMNKGGFAIAIEAEVRRFNGGLFASSAALPLQREEIGELYEAARADWRAVEPAIFGTLLEQALEPNDRRKLGAHYTPRAYVERVVIATVIDPLRKDWETVLSTVERRKADGDEAGSARLVRDFHNRLCNTHVLDPACGTGNFLYVALELMKRLEGEVLEALADLGGQESLAALEGHTVDPHQFLGLEVNPRAAAIAELVLWIGYLQWHFRIKGGAPAEPILRAFKNIQVTDALMVWDGYPVPAIVEGRENFPRARRPEWPAADFIVGNPPFIGGKDLRARLGDAHVEALWKLYAHINTSADFVMYWWDRAAELLTRKGTKLRRFGLVTTNSITQVFNRRVVARHLEAKKPVSLIAAVPDHPWTKATKDAAAVRIAMMVVEAGKRPGVLREVTAESGLDTDEPSIAFRNFVGTINADFTVGADVTNAKPLRANDALCSRGMALHGAGFIVTPQEAEHLGLDRREGLEAHIRPYRNGRDLMGRSRGVMVIDLFGLEEAEVRSQFPELYQHLIQTVRAARQAQYDKSSTRDAAEYLEHWWLFGKPREQLRPALAGLPRYIATVETAKHRVFQFLDAEILPDNMLVAIASDDAALLGVLSSSIHLTWTLAGGGTLEDRPRYNKSVCFDPFPFPEMTDEARAGIAALAEELDATRKQALAEHPELTLTGLYNLLEALRAGATLTPEQQDQAVHGRVLILRELHDRLDDAVSTAYGWPEGLGEAEILDRLVALNRERWTEEQAGLVRWLRPDYQLPRLGKPGERQIEATLIAPDAKSAKPSYPTGDDVAQTAAVLTALAGSATPLTAAALASLFRQGRKAEPQIAAVLRALARMGHLASPDRGRSFTLRRAAQESAA